MRDETISGKGKMPFSKNINVAASNVNSPICISFSLASRLVLRVRSMFTGLILSMYFHIENSTEMSVTYTVNPLSSNDRPIEIFRTSNPLERLFHSNFFWNTWAYQLQENRRLLWTKEFDAPVLIFNETLRHTENTLQYICNTEPRFYR